MTTGRTDGGARVFHRDPRGDAAEVLRRSRKFVPVVGKVEPRPEDEAQRSGFGNDDPVIAFFSAGDGQLNDIQYNDIQHNDISQHYDAQH